MNFKRLFAGALAIAMALPAINYSYAEPTGDFFDVGGTFVSDKSGFAQLDQGKVSFHGDLSHTDDETGSLKFEARTWQGMAGTRVAVGKSLKDQGLIPGETYLVKAYVYGERINSEDIVSLQIFSDYNTNENPFTRYASADVALVQGDWVEISQYFIANDKTSKFSLVFPKMTTTGGNDANVETYGIVYVDDVTIERQTDADDYFNSLDNGPKLRYAKDAVLMTGFQKLDLNQTKNVLVENEEVDLTAYLQTCDKDQTVADLVRTAADNQYITVSSSDRNVATYENGKIVAKGCGTAVLSAEYNDGTTTATSKLLVTVHPDNADKFILGNGMSNYATVTDPIDANRTGKIIITNGALNSSVPSSKPAVISFGLYNPAGQNANNRFNGITSKLGTKNSVKLSSNQWVDHELSYMNGKIYGIGKYSAAGWENVDIVIDYPLTNSYEEGYRLIKYYLNGNMALSYEEKIQDLEGFFGIEATATIGTIIRDLTIVSMDSPFKVAATNPAVSEQLSTLDDIDVLFNQQATINNIDTCADLYMDGEAVETVKVLSSDNKKLSVIPQGGLKINKEYTLRLNANSFTSPIGETLTGTTEFTFVTTNDKVSDVIGSGYKLLNSQIDLIENGNNIMKVGNETVDVQKTDEHTIRFPSSKTTSNTLTIPFEDSFKTDKISADRIIVEFDTKVDTVLNPDQQPKLEHQQESWEIVGQDASGNTGFLTRLGFGRTWNNPFGVWMPKFTLDENGNRKAGTTSGTYAVTNDIKRIASVIDDLGYAHVKIVYDLKQDNPEGDVLQTITVNAEGIDYNQTQYSTLDKGYPNVVNLTKMELFARDLNGSYGGVYASKDTYLKNLKVYALKSAPELIPDAEVKNVSIVDDNFEAVQNASALSGKTVYVTAQFQNNKLGDNTSYVLVAAAYDKATNKLIDVEIGTPATIDNGQTSEEEMITTDGLDLTNFEGTAEIRVFAWNSMEGAMPLTDVYKPF